MTQIAIGCTAAAFACFVMGINPTPGIVVTASVILGMAIQRKWPDVR